MKRIKLDYNPSTSKKTEKPNLTIYFGMIMATYSLGFVAMSAFSSFYLLGIGLSNSTVGILLAVGSLLAVFLEPVVGALIDRHPKVSTKYVLLILSGLMAVIGPVFILLSGKNLTLSTLLYGFCIMLLMLAQPILKTLGMDTLCSSTPSKRCLCPPVPTARHSRPPIPNPVPTARHHSPLMQPPPARKSEILIFS